MKTCEIDSNDSFQYCDVLYNTLIIRCLIFQFLVAFIYVGVVHQHWLYRMIHMYITLPGKIHIARYLYEIDINHLESKPMFLYTTRIHSAFGKSLCTYKRYWK
jgi:hypothetical protein